MFKMKTITLSLLALLLVMSFASCASDTTSDLPLPSKDMKAYLQVKVTVEGSGDTRASRVAKGPQGGEGGDDREPGINKENEVNSLAVLLYESDKDDLSDDNAIIDYVYTFTNLTKATTSASGIDATYTTVPKEIDPIIVGKNYHVLVIANAGDMTSRCKEKKISEIRDMQMDKVCTRNDVIANFTDFVMSSKKDAKIDFSGKPGSGTGTESDPYVVNVDIERLAARIDIIPNATFDGTSQGYYYNVMDGTNVIGGFKLESVTPTKVMTKGEYLIKRVSSDAAVSSVTYFGLETKDADNKATNYVACPWTKARAGLTLAEAEGPTSLYNVKETTSTSTTDPSYILDYVMENTTTDNKEDNSTGLIFKGKYYESSEWDATKKQPTTGATGTEKKYTYTLRHSDPSGSGTTADPMHFGVVRNNIYQVKVDGVEGKSKGIKLTIHVVPWAHYDHGEVIY